jgi:hypothetical protein
LGWLTEPVELVMGSWPGASAKMAATLDTAIIVADWLQVIIAETG